MSEPRPLWASTISNEVVAANSPVVAGGQAYLGAFDGNLYAFQADGCGAARCPPEWWGRTGGAIRNTPAVGDGSVFVGSDVLYAFPASGCGRRTCRPSWVGETQTRIRYSSPVVAGGRVYVASSWPQETLYAFRSRGCGADTCPPEWTSTGLGGAGGIFSSPAVSGGFVFLQADTRLVAFQAAGCGSKICPPAWTGDTRTETESSSTPAVSDRKVYIGGGDCQAGSCGVWVFDAKGCGDEQCEPLWRGVTKGGIDASPTVGSGRVYIPAEDGRLYAFDAAGCGGLECQPLWTARVGPPGSFPTDPALASGLVVVRSEPERGGDGTLYAFPADGCGDRACGPLWSLVLHDAGHSSPAITGDAMFVSAGDGIVRAYRLA